MTDERKQIESTERARLGAPVTERERILLRYKKRWRRWYVIYGVTTVAILILSLSLLIGGLGRKTGIFASGGYGRSVRFAQALGELILGNDFMDLSGSRDKAGNTEQDVVDKIIGVIDGVLTPETTNKDGSISVDAKPKPITKEELYAFDYSKVPSGHTPILPMDLSLADNGAAYINNTTGLNPDTDALLAAALRADGETVTVAGKGEPLVLILHTHATEAYSEEGAISFAESGEICRTEDREKNVVAVGEVLAEVLQDNGIPTLHCQILHDELQYKDSYARAEQTIRSYLEQYPSIRLVIDLHRDSIVRSSGELVRPITLVEDQPTAQVMCVVGSSWGGEACPRWERNLSLAMKLRESLNAEHDNLCRPTYLRSSTYNQEIAPYSLLLEIGSSGNSLEEAKRAVEKVGEALSGLIRQM